MDASEVERRAFGRIVVAVGTYDAMIEENCLASIELLPDRVRVTNHGFTAGSDKARDAIRTVEAGGVPDRPGLKFSLRPREVRFAEIAEIELGRCEGGLLGHLGFKKRRQGFWQTLTKPRPRIEFNEDEEPAFVELADGAAKIITAATASDRILTRSATRPDPGIL